MSEEVKPGKVKLKKARLSYPALFKPKAFKGQSGGTPKFQATFLLDKKKDAKQIEAIKKAMDEAKAASKLAKIKLPADKVAFRDGDEKVDGKGEPVPEYEGMMYLVTSNANRVPVVDRDRTPLAEEDNKVYAGCYVNAVVRFWAQDNEFGKRMNCSLEAVQFDSDGERFGAAPVDPNEEFEELEEEEV